MPEQGGCNKHGPDATVATLHVHASASLFADRCGSELNSHQGHLEENCKRQVSSRQSSMLHSISTSRPRTHQLLSAAVAAATGACTGAAGAGVSMGAAGMATPAAGTGLRTT